MKLSSRSRSLCNVCERREEKRRERREKERVNNIKKCKKKKKAVVRKKQKNIYEQKIHIWEMLKAQYNLANMYANVSRCSARIYESKKMLED